MFDDGADEESISPVSMDSDEGEAEDDGKEGGAESGKTGEVHFDVVVKGEKTQKTKNRI